ncbi:unnamed protein product [Dovyalis caffra]|uniref:Crossover junction endonuclease MUS81 n=1 Tax=Dovyalis caffra TaxID=77055 RepID=A0AAV1RU87_9ROSI|nr:unnamed protein product [Dovyalis caffra]
MLHTSHCVIDALNINGRASVTFRYMLTDEGRETARECLMRSRMEDPGESLANLEGSSDLNMLNTSDMESVCPDSAREATFTSIGLSRQKKSIDVPLESLERFMRMGYSKEKVIHAFSKVSETSHYKEISSLWPAVLCRLREDLIYGVHSEPETLTEDYQATSTAHTFSNGNKLTILNAVITLVENVRRLPVGDGIWIARHKYLHSEYVLDFIVERKKIDDLRSSIRDNRYRDQKLRLLRCGLKKLIYLVEGDPNSSEAAESIKTACFTTEILEGFDVQRTNSLRDTLKKYAHLTQSIAQYYRLQLPEDQSTSAMVCPPFDEFIKRCQDLDKMTVSDVFAVQLMQVPQVTEEIAMAVLELYPTLLSLARAYSLLEGDVSAQENMLRKQSNNAVSAVASRNIFRLVWSNDQ